MSGRLVAAIFAGQGCLEPGIGLEWTDHAYVEQVSARAQIDVGRALTRFTSDLDRTSVLQPLLVALSLIAWEGMLTRGIEPLVVAGHSVGELAACSAAGAFAPDTAIALAAARGEAMERAARARAGGMLALAPGTDVDAALALGRLHGEVVLAAMNGPSQNVLSGDPAALEAVARGHGGQRLRVSGAWHSPAMHAARDELRPILAKVSHRPLTRTLVSSLDGRPLGPGEVATLEEEITAPVAWHAVLGTLGELGVTDVLCLAPGRVMRSLARDALGPGVELHVVDSNRDLDRIAQVMHRPLDRRAS